MQYLCEWYLCELWLTITRNDQGNEGALRIVTVTSSFKQFRICRAFQGVLDEVFRVCWNWSGPVELGAAIDSLALVLADLLHLGAGAVLRLRPPIPA